MGLLHILPRLGKSGGHIPHSSPFSYSHRLSPFFLLFTSSPRRSRGLLSPALGRGTHGTLAGELLEEQTEWAAGSSADRCALGAAADASG